jgi:hypothetical protein
MRSACKTILALLGLLAMLAGILFFVDGLLPIRSHAPNPSGLEMVVGFVAALAGFLVRSWALRRALPGKTTQ